MIKYDRELPILLCQVVLNFVLEVLKKSGILFHLYCINPESGLSTCPCNLHNRPFFSESNLCETPIEVSKVAGGSSDRKFAHFKTNL